MDDDSNSVWHVTWGRYKVGGSRWDRLRLKAAILRYRIRDAWLVLRGKADIDF